MDGSHEFIELQLNRRRILVLRALDEEDHQECHDGGAGADHQLPGVREAKERPGMTQARTNASARPKAHELPAQAVACRAKFSNQPICRAMFQSPGDFASQLAGGSVTVSMTFACSERRWH
jgi:hypothetical protein